MKNYQHLQQQFKKSEKRSLIIGLTISFIVIGIIALYSGPRNAFLASSFSRETLNNAPEDPVQQSIKGNRGNLYDRNFNTLATSYKTNAVYARPLELETPEIAAGKLAEILGLNEEKLLSTLKAERGFIWLGREIGTAKAQKISSLDIKGIYLVNEMNRFYPNGQTAAHVIGFATNEQGLDGIEFYYDNILQAEAIEQADLTMVDAAGHGEIGTSGFHLILTIDLRYQKLLEQYLDTLLKKTKAQRGMAALMSPKNGAFFALVNLPTFDPNHFWDYSESARRNRFITDVIFPGGLDQFFHQAIILEQIKKSDQKTQEQNKTAGNNSTITPEKQKRTILEQEPSLDNEMLIRLKEQFSFNRRYGIDLPVKSNSNIGIKRVKEIDYTISDNSGDTATALQLLSSFSSLVKGGRRITPHLLAAVRDQATGREFSTRYNISGNPVIRSDLQQTVLRVLQGLGKPGPSDSRYLESMLPQPSRPGPSEGVSREIFVNYVMLGVIPKSDPMMTFIVVLDHIDLTSPAISTPGSSPMLLETKELTAKVIKWRKETPAKPSPLRMTANKQKTKKQKNKKQKLKPASLTQKLISLKMPQVTGRSLRQGLQILQQYNLRISVIGSGLIIAQHPPAGTPLTESNNCTLQLHMDN